ncbi:MAG TPA: ABC transporter ATP-binding protein [Firmicutes bacterium]|nr:ABC transporter ATP-binding protein [Bacillota bacterium]
MEDIIEIRHLTKDYGEGRGVFDVSFSVHQGECFGFLGPNGAGKSTTIRHLMGFSVPDSGETLLRGQNSLKNREVIMQGVSYIPGEVALPSALKGSEVIQEQRRLKGVADTALLDWLIKTFEYDPTLYCKEMSLGMKRKTAIICAFMSDPDIIIMDEPSSGLDPEMQERFVELVEKEKERGKTILLSSHIFQEVDACCDRIAVIKDGRIVSNFVANDLKHKSTKQYHLTYGKEKEKEAAKKSLAKKRFKTANSSVDPKRLSVFVDEKDTNRFLKDLPREGLMDLSEKKETLEDYFMSFYKEDRTYGGIGK